MTPDSLRAGLLLLTQMRGAAIRERRADILPALEALESAAIAALARPKLPARVFVPRLAFAPTSLEPMPTQWAGRSEFQPTLRATVAGGLA